MPGATRTEKKEDYCGKCDRVVREKDNALECEQCRVWYHVGCDGVHVELYKVLAKHEDQRWSCSECTKKGKMNSKKIKDLEDKNEELQRKLREMKILEDRNAELEQKVRAMEAKWENFKVEIVTETVDRVREMIKEDLNKVKEEIGMGIGTNLLEEVATKVKDKIDEERVGEERKKNIVLYLVPESKKAKVEDREKEDKEACEEIFEKILKVDRDRFEIQQVVRLGQEMKQDRCRPLLVKLRNEREKWRILSQAKRLKEADAQWIKKIRMNKDLTEEERIEEKKLIDALWEKRNNGDDSWQIKNGKLVKKM